MFWSIAGYQHDKQDFCPAVDVIPTLRLFWRPTISMSPPSGLGVSSPVVASFQNVFLFSRPNPSADPQCGCWCGPARPQTPPICHRQAWVGLIRGLLGDGWSWVVPQYVPLLRDAANSSPRGRSSSPPKSEWPSSKSELGSLSVPFQLKP